MIVPNLRLSGGCVVLVGLPGPFALWVFIPFLSFRILSLPFSLFGPCEDNEITRTIAECNGVDWITLLVTRRGWNALTDLDASVDSGAVVLKKVRGGVRGRLGGHGNQRGSRIGVGLLRDSLSGVLRAGIRRCMAASPTSPHLNFKTVANTSDELERMFDKFLPSFSSLFITPSFPPSLPSPNLPSSFLPSASRTTPYFIRSLSHPPHLLLCSAFLTNGRSVSALRKRDRRRKI